MGIFSKVFAEEPSNSTNYISRRMFFRLLIIGVISGVAIWLIAMLLDRVVLTPVFCGSESLNVSVCANSASLGGYISAVLIGVMTVPLLAVAGVKRPLLVVLAVTLALWGLPMWGGGMWVTSMIFSMVIYFLTYATVLWLNRIKSSFLAILALLVFVVLARIVLSL